MDQKKAVGCGLRTALWGIVLVGGIVIGFIFLLRSCLSQWDNYGVKGWPGITDDQKTMVLVKSYSKTNSYSSKNGMTHISYSTTYYLEKIDLASGKVVQKKKLMNHRKIKKGGFQCFGGYKNRLWIFANYLRAYDMNTLEQVVKLEDIENKNPQLKGKMPIESQYYDAHINLGYIAITALDGDKYKIMLDDLHAELIDPESDSFEYFSKELTEKINSFKSTYDSLVKGVDYDRVYDDYRNKKITRKEMEDQISANSEKLNRLNQTQDSLRGLENSARDIFQDQQDLQRMLEDFDAMSSDMSDWVTLKDTAWGNGYVMDKEEPDDQHFDISNFSSMGSESDKVKLFRLVLEVNQKSSSRYDHYIVKKVETLGTDKYLQGGLMRDYRTAKVYQTKNPGGFIIFSRDIIGDKGKLLVTRVDMNGKKVWQTDAQMSFKLNWVSATDSYLIICGIIKSDKTPFNAEADAVRIFDLKTGNLITVKY